MAALPARLAPASSRACAKRTAEERFWQSRVLGNLLAKHLCVSGWLMEHRKAPRRPWQPGGHLDGGGGAAGGGVVPLPAGVAQPGLVPRNLRMQGCLGESGLA